MRSGTVAPVFTVAVGLAGGLATGLATAPKAFADPLVYLEMTNDGASSGELSGNGGIDISGLTVGNYTIGAGVVSTTPNNLSALDFANFATTNGGTPGLLQIEVSATGLSAPIPTLVNFITQATGNILDGALLSMTIYTYADSTNAVFGMQTLLDTITINRTNAGFNYDQTQNALWEVLNNPFSETFIIDLTLAGDSDISSDTSLVPSPAPEPASVAIMGFGLLTLVAARRRWFRVTKK
jgi:hypothetical protein